MRLSLAGLALAGMVLLGGKAQAQPPPEAGDGKGDVKADGKPGLSAVAAEARAHYKQGVAHFNLDEWKPAMEEFKTAYRLYPDPTFLYNIALCHRKLGEHAEALNFYRKYLRERPDAKNRDEVQRRIEELEPIVAAEARAPKAEPPPAPAPVAAAPTLTPPPVAAPPLPTGREPVITGGPPPAEEATAAGPLYKKWWLWAGVGAVVLAGTLTAVALSRGGGAQDPMYHPGDLSPGQITVPTK